MYCLALIVVVQPVWWRGFQIQIVVVAFLMSAGYGEVTYLKSISEMRWDS